ncbi:dynactin subunit 2 [Bipolaris maydis]|nr:dynactin subunit 2 [Bipolaris maydis]
MLLLDYQNVLIESLLRDRVNGGAPANIDQVVSDFDGVTFHISTPETKTKILVSLHIKCFKELVQYGAQAVLEREYGPFIVEPESGYDFSVLVDLENLPEDQEAKDDLVRRVALLKRNAMAAPFEQAFDEFHQLQEEASKYTSESAPQGVAEGGDVRAIHYREEEAIYVKASHDRVTVIFSTVFREETDRIFGKVFLQEFVDARRRAIQNAPQVLFRNDPPLELQGIPGVDTSGSADIGYITFVLFPRHLTNQRRADVISHIQTFHMLFVSLFIDLSSSPQSSARGRREGAQDGQRSYVQGSSIEQMRKQATIFTMSEATRPKYDNLPGIDTAPDIYETPELTEDVSTVQASTAVSESDYGDDDDNGDSAVRHQRLQPDQARNRFQPARVDARGVDFSDNVTAQRQSYRTSTRRQRRRGEIIGDASDEEEESFAQKLLRIKRELAALEDEYEQNIESGDKSKIEEQDPKEMMEMIASKVDTIYAAHKGGARGAQAILDRTVQKFDSYKPFDPSPKLTKAIANQPPLPGTQVQRSQLDFVLNQAAEFDKRITQLEGSLGLNGNTMPELSDHTPFPVSATLTRLEQTMGLIGDAASNNLDTVTQNVKKLTAEAEHLKEVREEAAEAGAGSNDNSSGAYPDQEAKINALYGTLPSIDKLSPILPLVLERLRTLRLVHTSAWQADEVLTELERRQSAQELEIKKWEQQLEILEKDIKRAETAMVNNIKTVGDDVKMLEEKMAKLLSADHEQ